MSQTIDLGKVVPVKGVDYWTPSESAEMESVKTAANTAAAIANKAAENANTEAAKVTAEIEKADAAIVDMTSVKSAAVTATTAANNATTNANAAAATASKATKEMEAQAASDHSTAQSDHSTAGTDHATAQTDHTQATSDHTQATSDHANYTADRKTFADDEAARQSTFETNESARQSTFNTNELLRDAKVDAKVAAITTLQADDARAKQTLGHYTDRADITLAPSETGVAISKDGVKVSKSGWAIAEFTAVKGNEYLFNPGTMDGNVCLFAEKITKQETRNIDYTYTYDDDGNIATAKATYGGSTHTYTYTYTYDEEGKMVSETITDDQTGAIISALPYQYKTSIGTYQPMTILNASAELPADGYCRLVSHFQNDSSLTVVVSYNTADANLTMKVVRDGYTASICTQLSNLAKRISNTSDYATTIDEQSKQTAYNQQQILADVKAVPDYSALPLLCGQPPILYGEGTPQESIVPTNWKQFDPSTGEGYNWNGEPSALGQVYINTSVTSGGRYTAVPNGVNGVELKWVNF